MSVDDHQARVVIGVRADFYAACLNDPGLAAAIRGRQILVGAMSAAELREAIVRPAERAGLIVEGALVTTIVAEVAGRPGALPLASHALLEAWRRRRGNAVVLAGYAGAGGVRHALAQTAEAIYADLAGDQRLTVRQVMTRLVALGDGVDSRRRVPRAELDLPGTDEVLDRLARARLITVDQKTVEIAHEALIGAWPRLGRWLSENREGLEIHRRLTEAAFTWLSVNRDDGALYRGVRLVVAREWAAHSDVRETLTEAERTFLDASAEVADREAKAAVRRGRQLRSLAGALAILLGLVSVVTVVAVVQRREAIGARQTAISRQLAVQAMTQANSAPGTAMLLSVQALRMAPTIEARSAVTSMAAHQAYSGSFVGHRGPVSEVAFAPDGQTAFSVGFDQTVRVWDVVGRRQTAVLTEHQAWLTAMSLSPDGRTLATGGDDNNVVLWDAARLTITSSLVGHSEEFPKLGYHMCRCDFE